VAGKGMVEVPTKHRMKNMKDVYHTPYMVHSLLSVGNIMKKNYKMGFKVKK